RRRGGPPARHRRRLHTRVPPGSGAVLAGRRNVYGRAKENSVTAADIHLDADLVVIGYGKGGKTLAATLARQGWSVVMMERSPMMYGGTCINTGCVPTKALIARSEHLAPGAHPQHYRDAVAATAQLTSTLRAANFAMLDTLDAATVLTGEAVF